MAINKYQKFLYAIELNDRMTNNFALRGRKLAPAGWNRETPLPTAPYANISTSRNVPSPKCSYTEIGQDYQTPAGRMTDRDYLVVHGNIVASPARQAQHFRQIGR